MLEVLKDDLQDDLRSLGVRSIQDLKLSHLWAPDQARIESIVQACKQKRDLEDLPLHAAIDRDPPDSTSKG